MAVSGIGNTYTYVYNTQTGKLSTKDGSKNDFVDYFNGESSEEALDILNGFDAKRKDNIQNMIEVFEQASKGGITRALFDSSKGTEFEISEEIENATTAHYSIDGTQVFTAYSAVSYTYEEVKIFGTITNFPYKNHQHRDYDPEKNSIGIAVGDEFDMGNGYRFKVLEDRIRGEGWGSGTEEDDKKANQFMWGLSGLIHFGDQQSMASRIDKETTPMMLEFLRQLGVDTSREFIINDTRCEIMYGRIKEVGNMVGVPGSIQNEAVRRYEELLYQPLSTWKERNRQNEEQVEMMAFYAENSTDTDPVIRINCNYGGENRYFDVHVNEVDPRNASQMEMFALSCYQDDKGLTDRGSFGSYSRMKNYAGNAAMSGSFPDLQDVENMSAKMDWVSMLEQMAQQYLQNAQTYSQYLDCKNLAEKQALWSDNKMKMGEDTLIVRERAVASLESGVSFYFDEEKHTVRCVDDRNPKLGRNVLWEKSLTEEQFLSCDKLFERYRDKNTWAYRYDRYLAEEAFWDKYLNGEIDLAELGKN